MKNLKPNHHKYSTVFSITVRDGRGINLGEKSHNNLVEYLSNSVKYAVLTIEKSGNAAHFQGGAVLEIPVRQDKFKEKIKALYKDIGWDEAQQKYALVIKAHDNVDVLFKYCIKENKPIVWKFHSTIAQFKGCICSGKYVICYHCDPHEHHWDNHIDYSSFWLHQLFANRNKGHSFWDEDLQRADLTHVYGPLTPSSEWGVGGS